MLFMYGTLLNRLHEEGILSKKDYENELEHLMKNEEELHKVLWKYVHHFILLFYDFFFFYLSTFI